MSRMWQVVLLVADEMTGRLDRTDGACGREMVETVMRLRVASRLTVSAAIRTADETAYLIFRAGWKEMGGLGWEAAQWGCLCAQEPKQKVKLNLQRGYCAFGGLYCGLMDGMM